MIKSGVFCECNYLHMAYIPRPFSQIAVKIRSNRIWMSNCIQYIYIHIYIYIHMYIYIYTYIYIYLHMPRTGCWFNYFSKGGPKCLKFYSYMFELLCNCPRNIKYEVCSYIFQKKHWLHFSCRGENPAIKTALPNIFIWINHISGFPELTCLVLAQQNRCRTG